MRRGEPLGRRAHLAAAVRRRERRRIDAEAEDGTRTEAEASAEAGHGEPPACGRSSDVAGRGARGWRRAPDAGRTTVGSS